MALPVPVDFHDDEPTESFCDRLSAANGFASTKQFLSLTAINSTALAAGTPADVDRLARWSGQDTSLLGRYRVAKSARRLDWHLGDAVFNKNARRGRRFRYCPNCVKDDFKNGVGRPVARPYVRLGWLSRDIKTCTTHSRPIVEVPIPSKSQNSFCRFVSAKIASIEAQAAECPRSTPAEVDSFAENRIRGILREPYLDRFEAHIAIDLCSRLGQFVKRHSRALSDFPSELRSAPAREIGFFIARRGEATIRETVTSILMQERPTGTHKFIFDALGRWLRSNSKEAEFAELVELFQDIAERTLPFAKGEMCFIPVRRRYVHSVISAGLEYSLHQERIVALLLDAGMSVDATLPHGSIFFDADKAHEILKAASQTLTSRQARDLIGVSEDVMASLLERGLMPRVEHRDDVRIYNRIRAEDLENFRERIFSTVKQATDSMVNIATICQRTGCVTADILSALIARTLQGFVSTVNHRGKIGALRFDLQDAINCIVRERATLSELADAVVVDQREAASKMAVKPNTIPYLCGLGLLTSSSIKNPVNNRLQQVVTLASISEFQTEYIRVSELAAVHETHPIRILDQLRKLGVTPIFDGCGPNVSRFFRRSEIDDAAISIPKIARR